MEYIAVLNNYLEYSLDDNRTVNSVNLPFQSTSMHVFHAAVSIQGHPTSIFGKYLFRRRFEFSKFLACLTLLGFSNI